MTKIEFAEDAEIQKYFEEMIFVLDALEKVEEGWGESLLTDESSVEDFLMQGRELKTFQEALGLKIKQKDTIISICKKLRKKFKKS